MRAVAVATVALGLGLLAAGAQAADQIRVVAAENFYGEVAAQIGGEHVAVTSILSNPDTDPHLFEASADTARSLADAAVAIENGADYDPWMDRLLSASGSASRTTIVVADIVGAKTGDNPHLWYEPTTLPMIAAALAAEFARRDPADAGDFAANLQTFNASFAAAIAGIAAIRTAYMGRKVTATEPVVGYLAAAMGLDVTNMGFQLAAMNDTEPSVQDVAAFEDSLRNRTVKIMFYNSQVSDDVSARLLDIAKQSGIPVVGVTETEPAGTTIEAWFASEIAAVQSALAANP